MLKKVFVSAAIIASALASMAISTPAQAREGAISVGHGIKCYYYLGIQYCYKGV